MNREIAFKMFSLVVMVLIFLNIGTFADSVDIFRPGFMMKDIDGNQIKAFGGGFLYQDGVYYWYGEFKYDYLTTKEILCYTSSDLYNWKYYGNILPQLNDPKGPLASYPFVERPKVVYNEKTRKYVMWLHLENSNYSSALSGVALSDKPTGPFLMDSIFYDQGHNRDMTVYKDDDGRAYHVFSYGLKNEQLMVSLLGDDYRRPSGKAVFTNLHCEAPAIFKHKGVYYMLKSSCTGFAHNNNDYATADSMLGKWTNQKMIARGPNSSETFQSQVSFVLPVQNKKDAFIFVSDRWTTPCQNSLCMFLPLHIIKSHDIAVYWKDKWNLSIFDSLTIPFHLKSLRINCGGPTYYKWSSDYCFKKGFTFSTNKGVLTKGIENVGPNEIYKSCRWGVFTYNIKDLVPNSSYIVMLHFAELYFSKVGERKFNISLNDSIFANDFDIVAEAGGADRAFVKKIIAPSDSLGEIRLAFTKGSADKPIIMGIECIQENHVQELSK